MASNSKLPQIAKDKNFNKTVSFLQRGQSPLPQTMEPKSSQLATGKNPHQPKQRPFSVEPHKVLNNKTIKFISNSSPFEVIQLAIEALFNLLKDHPSGG